MRNLFLSLFLVLALVFGTSAFALTPLLPPPFENNEGVYLSHHFAPDGSVLSFIDLDNDGICDQANVYGVALPPNRPAFMKLVLVWSCEKATEMLKQMPIIWKNRGQVPRAYDLDTKKLVQVEFSMFPVSH